MYLFSVMDSFWASRQSAEARDLAGRNTSKFDGWSMSIMTFRRFPPFKWPELGVPLTPRAVAGRVKTWPGRWLCQALERHGLWGLWAWLKVTHKVGWFISVLSQMPKLILNNYLWIMVLIPSMARIIIQSKPQDNHKISKSCGSMLILRMTSRSCGSCFWQSRRVPFWCQRRHASPNHH